MSILGGSSHLLSSFFCVEGTHLVIKSRKREQTKQLYDQFVSSLRERILSGHFSAGMRLPSDTELAIEAHLSRDQVRQALALLTEEGLLERKQGRGTFVLSLSSTPVSSQPATQKQIGLMLNHEGPEELNIGFLVGVEQALKVHGYSVTFNYTEEDQAQQAQDIERMQVNHVAGMIICPLSGMAIAAAIQRAQVALPVVLIDRYLPELSTDYVGVDNRGAAYRATEHLLILGHKRIGMVISAQERLQTTSIYERWQGYCEALRHYKVAYDESLVVTATNEEDLKAAIGTFLRREDRPDAIFAVNDYVALDVMEAAREQGIAIPADLALVGFDDINLAAHLSPPLTTIAQPFQDIGFRAGMLLLSRIEGMTGPARHISLPANLIVRESCGVQSHIKKALSL